MSDPDDFFEREAERIAEIITRDPVADDPAIRPPEETAGDVIQRSCTDCSRAGGREDDDEEDVTAQRQYAPGAHAKQAPRDQAASPRASETGSPLPAGLREDFEQRFGRDFGQVRIHSGVEARESARSLDALAYTVGPHLYISAEAAGFDPERRRRLLAHELTHVVQQGAAEPLPERAKSSPLPVSSVGHGNAGRMIQRRVSARMPELRDLLSYDIDDWVIRDEEARKALGILALLSSDDLRDTAVAMDREGLVENLLDNVPDDASRENRQLLRGIASHQLQTREIEIGGQDVTQQRRSSCTYDRLEEIYEVRVRALALLDEAIGHVVASQFAHMPETNRRVSSAMSRVFRSTAPNVVAHVQSRLNHIRRDIDTIGAFDLRCSGAWDVSCQGSNAYVPGDDPEAIAMCNSFFDASEREQALTLIHEVAHTQVGGRHIADRGYMGDRAIVRLRTEEALTNAASYEWFVSQLTSTSEVAVGVEDEFEDCEGRQETIREAIALAERSNQRARKATKSLTIQDVRSWPTQGQGWLVPATDDNLVRARNTYRQADRMFGQSIDFECEQHDEENCASRFIYWYNSRSDLHICPLWFSLTPGARVVELLAACYRYFGLRSDPAGAHRLAEFAQDISRTRDFPSLAEVLGDQANWTSDLLAVELEVQYPLVDAGAIFTEDGRVHQRLSSGFPIYAGQPCSSNPLRFNCDVRFKVDDRNVRRPLPFTPPRVSVYFDLHSPGRTEVLEQAEDVRPDYAGPGDGLMTRFGWNFEFYLPRNGELSFRLRLQDPDTAVTREMTDLIIVQPVMSCLPATSTAPAGRLIQRSFSGNLGTGRRVGEAIIADGDATAKWPSGADAGSPLPAGLREDFERHFGRDFGHVRIHGGAEARESARSLDALAYTVGPDIFLGEEAAGLSAERRRRLLAHELTHVAQQRAARPLGIAAPLSVSSVGQGSCNPASRRDGLLQFTGGPLIQRAVSPQMQTIRENLSYSRRDWVIRDQEAREVLGILQGITDPGDLSDTVEAMDREGLVDRFFENLPEDEFRDNQELLGEIASCRVQQREGRQGTAPATRRGSCSFEQLDRIYEEADRSVAWLDRAVAGLDAFLSAPRAEANSHVERALRRCFASNDGDIAAHVRGRLIRIRRDLADLRNHDVRCHGDWDLTCPGAYVPAGAAETIVVCSDFFSNDGEERRLTLIHEMAHAQVGGLHISDRGYIWNRVISRLTPAQALTNAASYELFVWQLNSATVPVAAPRDRVAEDCQGWEQPIREAINLAEWYNNRTADRFEDLTVAEARNWTQQWRTWLGAITEERIQFLEDMYGAAAGTLGSRIRFECEPEGGGRCDRYAIYWWGDANLRLHICPSWISMQRDRQVVNLLAAAYRHGLHIYDPDRANDLAELAAAIGRSRTRPGPSLHDVLGGDNWTPDLLSVQITVNNPWTPTSGDFIESGTQSERLSAYRPIWTRRAPCSTAPLTFDCDVSFFVDNNAMARPLPFTPPRVSVLFEKVAGGDPQVLERADDVRPDYAGQNQPLETEFPVDHAFEFAENGRLNYTLTLEDPDTGVTREMNDSIDVRPITPCPGSTS